MPTPPTAVTSADLAEGTGTRSFSAVTTQAGDSLVVGIQVESAADQTFVPSGTGVTFPGTANADSGVVSPSRGRAIIWVGTDSAGGSRTVTVTPNAALNYRARLTVVRGSTGVGGTGASSLAQTVSVTRTGGNSMIFMGVTDWSAGAVGSPTWTPGGATQASQQGSAATYIFGRWDDSGSSGTANHGISTPSYTTPAVVALEMLGTVGGAAAAAPVSPAMPGRTWLRRFKHRQVLPLPPVAAGASFDADASLTVAATISPTAVRAANATASLTATAAISPTGAVTANATASPTVTATITATGATQANATSSLTATATISATATVTRPATAAPSFVATITPASAVTANGTASLSVTAAISATATVGAAPIDAQASLTGTATISPAAATQANAAATRTTTTAITVTAANIANGTASPTITAAITPVGAVNASTTANLTATATITAAASITGPFTIGALATSSSSTAPTASSSSTGQLTAASARGGPT